jgi:DNA ligase-4
VGTGLSFADYIWLRQKPWKVWDPKYPPEFLQTAKKSYEDKGDLYLEPEEYGPHFTCWHKLTMIFSSFILKVKAAEITTSGIMQCF